MRRALSTIGKKGRQRMLRLADGLTIEAVDYPGAASADPNIVLLHEGLGSAVMWGDFPGLLRDRTGLDVTCLSRAGYGNSSPPVTDRTPLYMHQEALVALPAMLKEAGISRRVLVGHSDGASIALIAAGAAAGYSAESSRQQEGGGASSDWDAHSLISQKLGSKGDAWHGIEILGVVAVAPHVFVESLVQDAIRATAGEEERSRLVRGLAKYHGDRAEQVWRDWHDIWVSEGFRSWDIGSYVAKIACPVLVIQGKEDQYTASGGSAQVSAAMNRISICNDERTAGL